MPNEQPHSRQQPHTSQRLIKTLPSRTVALLLTGGPGAWTKVLGCSKLWRTCPFAVFPHSRNGPLGPNISPSGFSFHFDLIFLSTFLFLPFGIGMFSVHLFYLSYIPQVFPIPGSVELCFGLYRDIEPTLPLVNKILPEEF